MPLVVERREHCYVIEAGHVNLDAWYYEIYQHLAKNKYQLRSSLIAKWALRTVASQYFEDKGNLYRKTNIGINLLCVTHE